MGQGENEWHLLQKQTTAEMPLGAFIFYTIKFSILEFSLATHAFFTSSHDLRVLLKWKNLSAICGLSVPLARQLPRLGGSHSHPSGGCRRHPAAPCSCGGPATMCTSCREKQFPALFKSMEVASAMLRKSKHSLAWHSQNKIWSHASFFPLCPCLPLGRTAVEVGM